MTIVYIKRNRKLADHDVSEQTKALNLFIGKNAL
jgi:hypothetical protein